MDPIDEPRRVATEFLYASIPLWVGVLVCYLVATVRFLRRGETAVGVLCVLCGALAGGGLMLGIPVAVVFGWLRAERWGTTRFMGVFTTLFVMALALIGVAFAILLQVIPVR